MKRRSDSRKTTTGWVPQEEEKEEEEGKGSSTVYSDEDLEQATNSPLACRPCHSESESSSSLLLFLKDESSTRSHQEPATSFLSLPHGDDSSRSSTSVLPAIAATSRSILPSFIFSSFYTHKRLLQSSTTSSTSSSTSSPSLSFRSILPRDRQVIQELHETWFPVTYQTEFYDHLVHGTMWHSGEPLYTKLIVKESCCRREETTTTQTTTTTAMSADSNGCSPQQESHTDDNDDMEDDKILAALVAAVVPARKLNAVSRELLMPDYVPDHPTSSCRHGPSKLVYLMTLGTIYEYRKAGLATQLMEQLMEDLIDNDPSVGTLYLHVITTNTAAIRFYERHDFWKVQEIPNYYTIEGEQHNCYLYAKYFHGNRGHLDIFGILYWWMSSFWHRVKAPVSYLLHGTTRYYTTSHRPTPASSSLVV